MVNASRWKSYAALVAVFVLGTIVGAGASHAHAQRRYARLLGDRPEFLETRRLGALSRHLDLDDAQRERMRAIIERHADERRQLTRDVFERCGAPLRAQQAATDVEIRAVLRPAQQPRFDAIAKERRDRFFPR
jgi:Spy/CpxP family protein refolding chaperone